MPKLSLRKEKRSNMLEKQADFFMTVSKVGSLSTVWIY